MTLLTLECPDQDAQLIRDIAQQLGLRLRELTPDGPPTWCATPETPTVLPARQAPVPGRAVTLHTDGACKGNPGPIGMGVLLTLDGETEAHSWGAPYGHNYPAELSAALGALNLAVVRRAAHITLVTDSDYLATNLRRWYPQWASGTLFVAHMALWNALFELITALNERGVSLEVQCVRSHSGHAMNTRADQLASAACRRQTYAEEPLALRPSA